MIDHKMGDKTFDIEGDVISIKDLFFIDHNDLTTEYSYNPSRLAYLGARMADAEAVYREKKAEKEAVYAEAEFHWRKELKSNGEKVTEAKLKSYVLLDDYYEVAVAEEIEALRNFKLLKALVIAMNQRGDMLISLGATLRQEYDATDMRMMKMKDNIKDTIDTRLD